MRPSRGSAKERRTLTRRCVRCVFASIVRERALERALPRGTVPARGGVDALDDWYPVDGGVEVRRAGGCACTVSVVVLGPEGCGAGAVGGGALVIGGSRTVGGVVVIGGGAGTVVVGVDGTEGIGTGVVGTGTVGAVTVGTVTVGTSIA